MHKGQVLMRIHTHALERAEEVALRVCAELEEGGAAVSRMVCVDYGGKHQHMGGG